MASTEFMEYPTIALVWSDAPLSSTAWAIEPTFENKGGIQTYDPAVFRIADIETVTKDGVTLSGRRYSTILWVYRNYAITLSSDDIDDDNAELVGYGNTGKDGLKFLRDFWTAGYKYISVYSNGVGMSDFRRVTNESGEMPFQFIDDLVMYPEISINLRETQPLSKVGGEYDFI